MDNNTKKGFISMSVIYSFLILFLFLTLSIMVAYLNKEKLISYIIEETKKEIESLE